MPTDDEALEDPDQPDHQWRMVTEEDGHRRERESEGRFLELAIGDWFELAEMGSNGYWIRIGDASVHAKLREDGSVFVEVLRGSNGPTNGTTDVPPRPEDGPQERVTVHGSDDTFYVRTVARPATGERDMRTASDSCVTGIGSHLDNYRGPDVIADFSEDGDLLGLELLYDDPEKAE